MWVEIVHIFLKVFFTWFHLAGSILYWRGKKRPTECLLCSSMQTTWGKTVFPALQDTTPLQYNNVITGCFKTSCFSYCVGIFPCFSWIFSHELIPMPKIFPATYKSWWKCNFHGISSVLFVLFSASLFYNLRIFHPFNWKIYPQ